MKIDTGCVEETCASYSDVTGRFVRFRCGCLELGKQLLLGRLVPRAHCGRLGFLYLEGHR